MLVSAFINTLFLRKLYAGILKIKCLKSFFLKIHSVQGGGKQVCITTEMDMLNILSFFVEAWKKLLIVYETWEWLLKLDMYKNWNTWLISST